MSSSESYAKSGGFNDNIDESDAILTQEEERLHAAARQPSGQYFSGKLFQNFPSLAPSNNENI